MKTIKWTMILVSSLASVSGFAKTNKAAPAAGITCGAQLYKDYEKPVVAKGDSGKSQPLSGSGAQAGTIR